MSKYSRKTRVDANHVQIATTLRQCAYSVGDLPQAGNSFPDLVVADRKNTVIMEIKTPEGFFYINQLSFLANWKGYAAFVETSDKALEVMKEPEKYCLSEKYKLAILRFVARFTASTTARNPKVRVTTFEKEINKILST